MAEVISTTPNLQDAKPLRLPSTLSANMFVYLGTTVIYLVLTAASTFIIPRLFTVEAFGTYRLFLLYAGFVGILHLGSLDGALTRWAHDPTLISFELGTATRLVVLLSVALAATAGLVARLAVGRQYTPVILFLIAFAVVANLGTVFQFALQARRRFDVLSALNAINPALLLAGIVIAAGLQLHDNPAPLICFLSSAIITTGISWRFATSHSPVSSISAQLFFATNTRIGLFVLLSNFSTNLMLAIDRFVVSFRFSLRDFAMYSFAASVLYSVNTIVLSAGRVFFPHVAGFDGDKLILSRVAGRLVLTTWMVGLIFFFPAALLVRGLLPQYVSSIPIIRILLLAAGPASLVQIVHFSHFRSSRRERRLLLGAGIGLVCCSIALIFGLRHGSLNAIAWAAVAGHFGWWFGNELLLDAGPSPWRDILQIVFVFLIVASTFYFCSIEISAKNALAYICLLPIGVLSAYGPEVRPRYPNPRCNLQAVPDDH